MAVITPLKITEESLVAVPSTSATSGDNFVNTGVEFVRIENTHASVGYTVTVTAQTTTYSFPRHGKLTKTDTVKTVGHGTSILIGPFKTTVWSDANGKVQLTYKVTSNNAALSTISSGAHGLKTEVLYLEQK